ncbi:2,3-diaminopropionate biosynthesis protein SbnB [Verrucosispora sp. WMMA2121]|uniref:2,3-diaminopropionate biosynthesis protein SbnB n=1 Tax=Verrucosispora sp. WMMA2121 TaxID=3015164 RepID=UPI0022B6BDB5|nr:2,3-diaminopropionate biosynthesis protein SbnB [Verrucosispora sp. WMMA2121]MCZ7421939.1 2,3-diaminopropionate biosynthesis protein SbnB [Verrucosispora sp. WMMA2121]
MVPGVQVRAVIEGSASTVISIIEDAYRAHGGGRTVNPDSYFLRFPDRPESRIIALPASLGGDTGAVDGIKWISSFPGNIASGLPRASAVLVLNDPATGYPYACLESSIISAARTAGSAALAARELSRDRGRPVRLGIVGTGLIARHVYHHLRALDWDFDQVELFDLVGGYAAALAEHIDKAAGRAVARVRDSAEGVIRDSDLVVLTTTAGEPHLTEPGWFDHHPLVLHLSLRDLSPEVIAGVVNVVDDVNHCLKANTSVHLLEQRTHSRDFIAGTLCDVLTGKLAVPADRTVVFSPFGLGVLDLAVGRHVYAEIAKAGQLIDVEGFFAELDRHA